jgi:exocyst complex component 3
MRYSLEYLFIVFEQVAERLNSVIEEGLEGQEYVSLLQWVEQTYPGPELMASPALGNIPNKQRTVL